MLMSSRIKARAFPLQDVMCASVINPHRLFKYVLSNLWLVLSITLWHFCWLNFKSLKKLEQSLMKSWFELQHHSKPQLLHRISIRKRQYCSDSQLTFIGQYCDAREDLFLWNFSRPGYAVLWFSDEEGKRQSGLRCIRPDEQFIQPHVQWSPLTPPSLLSFLTIPHFTQRGRFSLFFFRPQHNGGMVASAQSSTLSDSVHLSLWLIEQF